MSTIKTKAGTEIYYKDWGEGPVVTFSHGWPLSSDAWDGQMLFLAQHGFRVVAHDRRGHGRSSQASGGNDMNGYADDLAAVIEALDLKEVTLMGHSTGGGEVARFPVKDSAKKSARLIRGAQEIYYPGAPHGLTATHQDQVNADLLGFLEQGQQRLRKAARTQDKTDADDYGQVFKKKPNQVKPQ
jgi:non-heme chloroperoxidase